MNYYFMGALIWAFSVVNVKSGGGPLTALAIISAATYAIIQMVSAATRGDYLTVVLICAAIFSVLVIAIFTSDDDTIFS